MQSAAAYDQRSFLDRWSLHLIAAAALLVACLVPAPHQGSLAGLPSICLFHRCTGLPCPGCGMTRSVVCCAHGLWHEAVLYHPLGPLCFALLIGLAVLPFCRRLRPSRSTAAPFPMTANTTVAACYALVFMLVAVWIARLCGLIPSPPYL